MSELPHGCGAAVRILGPTGAAVTWAQFDAACAELAKANAPIKPDLDAAWAAFVQERAV